MPYAHRREILAPDGAEFSVTLNLSDPSSSSSAESLVLGNLVVARSSVLRIYQVRQQLVEPSASVTLNESGPHPRRGTEAVEGETQMDAQGDGFINVAEVKPMTATEHEPRATETRLHLLREHRLHGTVTGLDKVRTISSSEDGLDRLIVSFKDAKIALMEWSDSAHDLTTISIHTYERAPQLNDTNNFRSYLRVDPQSRCAALALPKDALAILPFHQSQAELDVFENQIGAIRDAPYAPSFVLDFPKEVDSKIVNIVDFVFLPGFNNITLAVLYQTTQTWTGRLNEIKDTASLSIITLDLVTHAYPNISRIDKLPYDSVSIQACPTSYGGVLIQTSTSLLHVDQGSRITTLPLNPWADRISSIYPPTTESTPDLDLDNYHLSFIDDNTLFLFLSNGNVHSVNVASEGRSVSKLILEEEVLGQSSIASCVAMIGPDHLFVGSVSGSSSLIRVERHQVATEASIQDTKSALMEVDNDDLDKELYGDTAYEDPRQTMNGTTAENFRTVLRLRLHDTLGGWGPIDGMTFSVNSDDIQPTPEVIACASVGPTSTFTRFQSHLTMKTDKRPLHSLGGNRGIWSLSVRRELHINGTSWEQPSSLLAHSDDTILVSSDATPAPGLSRILALSPSGSLETIGRTPAITIAAGTVFQRTYIVQVLTTGIRLLTPDGQEKQFIEETEAQAASISEPYVMVHKKDQTVSLYVGDSNTHQLVKQDNFKAKSYISALLFADRVKLWNARQPNDTDQEARLENVLNADRGTQWIVLYSVHGDLEIRALPSLAVVFQQRAIATLPPVIFPGKNAAETNGDAPSVESENEIRQLYVTPIGEGADATPHLIILAQSGLMVVYESVPHRNSESLSSLPIKFVKTFSCIIPAAVSAPTAPQRLIPWSIKSAGTTYQGVFCAGVQPFWLMARHSSPVRMYRSSHSTVYGFTPTSFFGSREEFLINSEVGPKLETWSPGLHLGAELPYKTVQTERPYMAVAYHPDSQFLVGASILNREFALFDEDGEMIPVDDPKLSKPATIASTVELISPTTWDVIDGFEFPQYEEITCLINVPLESLSTEAGFRNFIAVSTIIDRGEDLAARGAVYVFEVTEVVPSPTNPGRRHVLKLLCRDETKGPVTAVCGMNGYLVHSMGQKIFVRAFDLEERLVGVAFLDVGVYVTSLRSLKNFLLIGDVFKSTWFVCFQEDPFKMIVLSRDHSRLSIGNADFFYGTEGQLSFLTTDDEGVLRILDYPYQDPTGGQHLTCRTEFDGHSEHRGVLTMTRRQILEEHDEDEPMEITTSPPVTAQSLLLYGCLDGSLALVSAISDATFKHLSLLQGQLVRNVQHVAGLNPRAHRLVRNDAIPRPLAKGMLDGTLLDVYSSLDAPRQVEMTRQIGANRKAIAAELAALGELW